MRSDRALHTPEMDHAERELDARADYALSLARGLAAKVERFEQRFAEKEPPSDEDVDRMRKYILGHAMTEQWQRIVARIDRGELTWREIVDGLFHGTLDPEVSAAFRSLTRVPPTTVEELVQLGVLPAPPPDLSADEADDPDDGWFDDEDPLGRETR